MRLRIGVLGAGWVARARHIPAYVASPAVAWVSVFDRDPDRTLAAAAATGAIPWTGTLEGFLDQGLDAVSVCTSPWTHAELTIAALQHGLHVLTEKPMAMNATDARAMAMTAKSADRILCVVHNFLFGSAARAADRLATRIGSVEYAFACQLSSSRRRLPDWYRDLPAGLLFDELPHMLYVLDRYLGPLALDGVRATATSDGHPRTAELQLSSGDRQGQLVTVFSSPVSEWHVCLVGTKGILDLDLFRDFTTLVPSDGAHTATDIMRTSAAATAGHWWGVVSSGTRLVRGRQSWGHAQLIGLFLEAVRGRSLSPVPLESSLRSVELTDAILARLPT